MTEMDPMALAGLWINGGVFVATAAAAVFAWVQAKAALSSKDDAGKALTDAKVARDEAVKAQKAAAEALVEANQIAGDARDLMRAQDARDTERHHVEWEGVWQSANGKWLLVNRGVDTALDVRLVVDGSVIGRQPPEFEEEIPRHTGIPVQFPAEFVGTGNMPTVVWRVEWRTPLGTNHVDEGRFPRGS